MACLSAGGTLMLMTPACLGHPASWPPMETPSMTIEQLTLPLEPVKPEEWRPIPGYEEWYEVSDLGRIRSWKVSGHDKKRRHPVLIMGSFVSTGYKYVQLHKDRKFKKIAIHVLVLLAFVGPRPEGHDAAHADGARDNNELSNLRWASRAENMDDAKKHGTILRGVQKYNAVLSMQDVEDIKRQYLGGVKQRVIAAKYGIDQSIVSRVCSGKAYRLSP